jgi:hypothetical protein
MDVLGFLQSFEEPRELLIDDEDQLRQHVIIIDELVQCNRVKSLGMKTLQDIGATFYGSHFDGIIAKFLHSLNSSSSSLQTVDTTYTKQMLQQNALLPVHMSHPLIAADDISLLISIGICEICDNDRPKVNRLLYSIQDIISSSASQYSRTGLCTRDFCLFLLQSLKHYIDDKFDIIISIILNVLGNKESEAVNIIVDALTHLFSIIPANIIELTNNQRVYMLHMAVQIQSLLIIFEAVILSIASDCGEDADKSLHFKLFSLLLKVTKIIPLMALCARVAVVMACLGKRYDVLMSILRNPPQFHHFKLFQYILDLPAVKQHLQGSSEVAGTSVFASIAQSIISYSMPSLRAVSQDSANVKSDPHGPADGGYLYYFKLTRAEAITVLSKSAPGTFLVRPHETQSDLLFLSFHSTSDDGDIKHAVIRKDAAKSGFCYRCGKIGPLNTLLEVLHQIDQALSKGLVFDYNKLSTIVHAVVSDPLKPSNNSKNSQFIEGFDGNRSLWSILEASYIVCNRDAIVKESRSPVTEEDYDEDALFVESPSTLPSPVNQSKLVRVESEDVSFSEFERDSDTDTATKGPANREGNHVEYSLWNSIVLPTNSFAASSAAPDENGVSLLRCLLSNLAIKTAYKQISMHIADMTQLLHHEEAVSNIDAIFRRSLSRGFPQHQLYHDHNSNVNSLFLPIKLAVLRTTRETLYGVTPDTPLQINILPQLCDPSLVAMELLLQHILKSIPMKLIRFPGAGCGNGTDYYCECFEPSDITTWLALLHTKSIEYKKSNRPTKKKAGRSKQKAGNAVSKRENKVIPFGRLFKSSSNPDLASETFVAAISDQDLPQLIKLYQKINKINDRSLIKSTSNTSINSNIPASSGAASSASTPVNADSKNVYNSFIDANLLRLHTKTPEHAFQGTHNYVKYVDPWEVKVVVESVDAIQSLRLGPHTYVPYNSNENYVSKVLKFQYKNEDFIKLWDALRAESWLINTINVAHNSEEKNYNNIVSRPTYLTHSFLEYEKCMSRNLYRNSLFTRFGLPYRNVAQYTIDIHGLKEVGSGKDHTFAPMTSTIDVYAVVRLVKGKRSSMSSAVPGHNSSNNLGANTSKSTNSGRTQLDGTAVTLTRKASLIASNSKNMNSAVNNNSSEYSWRDQVVFRHALPHGLVSLFQHQDNHHQANGYETHSLYMEPPNFLQLSVYERTFFTDTKLGDIDLPLSSVTDEAAFKEWLPLSPDSSSTHSAKGANISTWFVNFKVELKFVLMTLQDAAATAVAMQTTKVVLDKKNGSIQDLEGNLF